MQKALPLTRTGGAVILNGSASGSKGFAGLSVYSATKAALRSFARTWTTDLKSRGIRVNVGSPGRIDTPARQTLLEENAGIEEALKQATPRGRIGQAEEVARVVLFLASRASSASWIGGVRAV